MKELYIIISYPPKGIIKIILRKKYYLIFILSNKVHKDIIEKIEVVGSGYLMKDPELSMNSLNVSLGIAEFAKLYEDVYYLLKRKI